MLEKSLFMSIYLLVVQYQIILLQIPGTLNNAYMEKGVKGRPVDDVAYPDDENRNMDDVTHQTGQSAITQINMIFYLFWYSLCFLLTVVCFFWADLIPGYGTVSSAKEFGERQDTKLGAHLALF